MGKVSSSGEPPAGRPTLEEQIAGLLTTPAGSVIFDQLARLVAEWAGLETHISQTYHSLLRLLLEDFSQEPTSDHILAVAATQIQSRHGIFPATTASIGPKELAARLGGEAGLPAALQALLERLGPPDGTGPVAGQACGRSGQGGVSAPVTEPAGFGAEQRVNSAYRQHLERQRSEIEKLQSTLAYKVREAISQNKEFGDLLQIERGALQKADGLEEVSAMRQILLGGIDELLKAQCALAENLDGTSQYLHLIETDGNRLRTELQKVRQLSLTDESTGLPNRRAFMRRLEDEIGRAQRYEIPLALAIIDLDEFKVINDNYGHAAGDQILRCYADQILSIFRHHDLVARYGGEEFAALLPNTVLEGALCALRKVQARQLQVECRHDDRVLPLPTFSAGLTLYIPGESLNTLIDRADRALYRAKREGRNRIQIDIADRLVTSAQIPELGDT